MTPSSAARHSDETEADVRVAYIISAHQNPQVLVRLVRRLDCGQNSFFIHYNLRSPEIEFRELAKAFQDMPNVRLLTRHKCLWGDLGLVMASLKGIEAIVAGRSACDYAVLLTGQDYPIKSNEMIRRRLKASAGRSFMESAPWPIPNWDNGRAIRRIQNFYFHPPFPRWTRSLGWPPSWQHLWIPWRRKIPGGLRPYFGSSFWCLHRKCLEYIQDYVVQNPAYLHFFRRAFIPDECFFQTLLMNSALAATIEPRSATYVDWRPPWPGILTMQDLPRLEQSECLFARKFDPKVDSEILERLDSSIENAKRHG
jgi:hypothetical protein